jgi:GNAT superfamily N-acetyltransferase
LSRVKEIGKALKVLIAAILGQTLTGEGMQIRLANRTGSWALIVSDQARGQGVGGQLVTAAELFATSRRRGQA